MMLQEEEAEGRRERNVERQGVRVRQGDVGAVHPSGALPGATGGVKLLTSVWTVVSGRAEVHQGNETPGFYYGPRSMMGGQKETLGGNRLKTMKKKEGNSLVVFILFFFMLFFISKSLICSFFMSLF